MSIEDAIRSLAAGDFVVVADDEDRENEGDLILAAEAATPEKIAFMLRHTSGIICTPLSDERLDALDLPQMVLQNTESHRTAFTVSVDYRHGTTTGVSAADRSATIRALADPRTVGEDFLRPGHIFPLRPRPGGVLKRAGHTEATVDLLSMAGMQPAGVLCELTNDDGTMMRGDALRAFAGDHGLPFITVADLIAYRCTKERLVERREEAEVATQYARFRAVSYRSELDDSVHLALVLGDVAGDEPVLTRVHRGCTIGDTFGGSTCSCGAKLRGAMRRIATEGRGVVVYLRGSEARGVHLGHADADATAGPSWREHGIGAQILADLGVRRLRLMTNVNVDFAALRGFDVDVAERVPLPLPVSEEAAGSQPAQRS